MKIIFAWDGCMRCELFNMIPEAFLLDSPSYLRIKFWKSTVNILVSYGLS